MCLLFTVMNWFDIKSFLLACVLCDCYLGELTYFIVRVKKTMVYCCGGSADMKKCFIEA